MDFLPIYFDIKNYIWYHLDNYKFTYVFKDTKNYSISYDSPVMGPLAHGYDIITAGPMMII